MTATIRWTPVVRDPGIIPCDTPGRVVKAIGHVFGQLPITLGEGSLPRLRAMDIAARRLPAGSTEYGVLADLIEAHGEIKIWTEY